MCWVPCIEQIPQKTLSLPTDISYDAGLEACQEAEYTLQPNYGVLSSYWKTIELRSHLKRLQILQLG